MKGRTALYSGVVALALASNAKAGTNVGINFPEPFVEDRSVSDVALIYPMENGDIVVRGGVRGTPGFVDDYMQIPVAFPELELIKDRNHGRVTALNRLLPNAVNFLSTLSTASALRALSAASVSLASVMYFGFRRRREARSFDSYLESTRA